MQKSNRKRKKLILIIIIILCIMAYFYYSSLKREEFNNYKVIKNNDELVELVNSDAVELVNEPFSDKKRERNYIEELSNSLISGYSYFSAHFTDEEIVIKNMDEFEILNLTYMFMTKGKDSVCIKEKYLNEMIYKYFRIDSLNISKEIKDYLYDDLKNSYCFEAFYSDINLELVNYESNSDSINLTYNEYNSDEDETYEWNIIFYKDNEGYYLYSFNNVIVGSEGN